MNFSKKQKNKKSLYLLLNETKNKKPMKKNYVSQFLIVFLFASISIIAQTEQEKKAIIKNYDLVKLNSLKATSKN